MAKKRKRLVRGYDFHGWAFKHTDGQYNTFLRQLKPLGTYPSGKWVRVRFVEVT